MTRILSHVRSNLIAYLALFVALGGTGYAATSLPAGSVGPAQLNHRLIGGYVRAWASVNPKYGGGTVLASSGGARVLFGPPAGALTIAWPGKFPRSRRACTVVATALAQPAASPLIAFYEGRGRVGVTTANGVLPGISLAVIC